MEMELLCNAHRQPAAAAAAAAAISKPKHFPGLLTDLAAALDHAAQASKLLSLSPAQSQAPPHSALASLRAAHHLLGCALARLDSPPPIEDAAMTDASEVDAEGGGGEGEESRIVEEVEEGMRECVLQSKRRKRPVSPSWAAGRAEDGGEEFSAAVGAADRRREFVDLVLQFHA